MLIDVSDKIKIPIEIEQKILSRFIAMSERNISAIKAYKIQYDRDVICAVFCHAAVPVRIQPVPVSIPVKPSCFQLSVLIKIPAAVACLNPAILSSAGVFGSARCW